MKHKMRIMKKMLIYFLGVLFLLGCKKDTSTDVTSPPPPDQGGYDVKTNDLKVRDPFIFLDKDSGMYYLHVNDLDKRIKGYKSKDLKNWKELGVTFNPSNDFWGKNDFWAPDMFKYKGKYYLFVTFSGQNGYRGTSVLVSQHPEGPFHPLVNKPLTPANWMCVDGTLFFDDSTQPWLLYSHGWIQIGDGEIVAQKLNADLTETISDPITLFKASDAPWVGPITVGSQTGEVSDAPFLYKLNSGELIMLWSSFAKNGAYSIGIATSKSGTIYGPWEQSDKPLNDDHGGHAMLFKDLLGRLMISYHAPNNRPRAKIYEVFINNGKLVLPK